MGQPRAVAAAAGSGPGPDGRHENALLRELVAIYSHLSALASQHAELDAVVRLVTRHTEAGVAVLGPTLDVLASAGTGDGAVLRGSARLAQVLAVAAQNRRPVTLPGVGAGGEAVVIAPVVVGDDVPAYLLTVVAEGRGLTDDMQVLLTEHAATICGILLGRERVVAAAAGRARLDLVEGLLLAREREPGEAERWASHLGFATGEDHHVLSVGPVGDPGPARVLTLVEHVLARLAPDAIVAQREGEVVAVVPAERRGGPGGLEGTRGLARRCLAELAERVPGRPVTVGIGGRCRRPAEIARSYGQARAALDATRRVGGSRGRVTAFEDLGINRLLLQVPDLDELRGFADEVLGDLLDPERDQRADLLATLTAYFRENGSPQRTSRALHVHPNTVAYRIRRVEEITGMHLDRYRDRLMAQVALEIVHTLRDLPTPAAGAASHPRPVRGRRE